MARLFLTNDPTEAVDELQQGSQVFFIERGKDDLYEYDPSGPLEDLTKAEQILILRSVKR